jgi:arylsulfatase A-like enzyme
VERTGYYTNLLADRAVEYVRRKHSQPFFLSLHFTAPHWPWEGPGDAALSKQLKDIWHWDGGSLDTYAHMVRALDDGVGRVLAELDAQGLSENTIVVFTSDNGGERFSDNWPFTGQKSELLEGGIRVPAIVRWPGRVPPGTTDQVAMTMDWLPTLLEVAQANPDPAFPSDGDTLVPILTGDRTAYARTLYWRFGSNQQRAMRIGDLKYLKIRDNEYLFDLARDVRERANLASLQPLKLAELRRNWEQWNEQMLPITADVFTGGPSRQQADRYLAPAAPR